MAGTTWLVDKSRIATKIKCASGACDPEKVTWKSNPTKACPSCQHAIDNSDVAKEWPGLPKGVKFDPSDQEIIWHLLAKVGAGNSKPHPFIDEFITTIEVEDGICYTHPQKLPGVKQDGNASHFFHRAIKAYNTGTRKRRKIHDQDLGDVRWHKTGRTKPVLLNGVQKGCKKIMVLYMSSARGGKAVKTNWVMHQYHLGTAEDENDGEYVISKVFYQQQQQVKLGDNDEPDVAESTETTEAAIMKIDPVTPKSATPELPFNERRYSDHDLGYETLPIPQPPQMNCLDEIQVDCVEHENPVPSTVGCEEHENPVPSMVVESEHIEGKDNNENNAEDGQKWWDGESQNLLDSQQLVEALSLCDDFFHSQSPKRDEKDGEHNNQPSLSVYAQLGSDHLKKDIEDCQNLIIDPLANVVEQNPVVEPLGSVEHDTPSEHQLSQLEFGSQDSFVAWGYSKVVK